MYKKVTFINAIGESVELFRQPLFLTKIEGLGDVDATIETQKSPNQDGSTHVYTTMNERPITMEIEILEDLREWRYNLSRIFNPKLGPGTLIYENGYVTKSITAQSEHVPTFPDVRPKRTQTALIDLICHDPYFRDAEDTRTDVAFWTPMFEFPLDLDIIGNPNLIQNWKDVDTLFTKWNGATVTYTKNQTVSEWGATDAIRIQTSGGTSDTKIFTTVTTYQNALNLPISTSVWVKNLGTKAVWVGDNQDKTVVTAQVVEPGAQRRVEITSIGTGVYHHQLKFSTVSAISDSLDFVIWRPKQEKSTSVTPWIPHVLDSDYATYTASHGVEFASRTLSTIVDIVNRGHVSSGMIIVFKATSTVVNPYLANVNTGEIIKLKRTMVAGEVIEINTNIGQKRITSTINGTATNIFNNIVFGSKFLQLDIGDNLFRFGADTNESFLEVQIYHSNKYAGV